MGDKSHHDQYEKFNDEYGHIYYKTPYSIYTDKGGVQVYR